MSALALAEHASMGASVSLVSVGHVHGGGTFMPRNLARAQLCVMSSFLMLVSDPPRSSYGRAVSVILKVVAPEVAPPIH